VTVMIKLIENIASWKLRLKGSGTASFSDIGIASAGLSV